MRALIAQIRMLTPAAGVAAAVEVGAGQRPSAVLATTRVLPAAEAGRTARRVRAVGQVAVVAAAGAVAGAALVVADVVSHFPASNAHYYGFGHQMRIPDNSNCARKD